MILPFHHCLHQTRGDSVILYTAPMEQRSGGWAIRARRLPGGRVAQELLLVVVVVLVASDILLGDVNLSTSSGWFELVFPFLPLLALLASPHVAAVTGIAAVTVLASLGAPMLLVYAALLSTIFNVGFTTFTLPRIPALVFAGFVLISGPLVAITKPDLRHGIVAVPIFTLCAAASSLAFRAFKSRAEQATREIEKLREEQVRIRNEERTRLAHELHDIVAHDVTVIAMQARRAETYVDPAKKDELLETIGDAASQALQDLRSLVVLLKQNAEAESSTPSKASEEALEAAAPSGETTTAAGLIHDVKNVAATLEKAGFHVDLELTGPVARVSEIVRQVLRRAVRELGTNVLKHGAPSGGVRLVLAVEEHRVVLSSSNRIAAGRPIVSSRTGIEAMKARTEVFEGSVVVKVRGGVWTTTIIIPTQLKSLAASRIGELV